MSLLVARLLCDNVDDLYEKWCVVTGLSGIPVLPACVHVEDNGSGGGQGCRQRS